MERISNGQSAENYKMIPDGVFIITDKESENSLLFFLEVDMGTETLVNSKGKPTDVRPKNCQLSSLVPYDDVSRQNTNVAKDIDYGYGYM